MSMVFDYNITYRPLQYWSNALGKYLYITLGQGVTHEIARKIIASLAAPIIGPGAAGMAAAVIAPVIVYENREYIVKISGEIGSIVVVQTARVASKVFSSKTKEEVELDGREICTHKKPSEEESKELRETPNIKEDHFK